MTVDSVRVSVETTIGLSRKATVSVPAATFESRITGELNKAATGLRVPGFRPGKVPMKEVRRRLDAQVRAKVARELSISSFSDAMREQPFTLATQPSIEIVNLAAGGDLEFTATFEVFPEIDLAPLDSLRIRKPEVDVDETDVDYTIEQLRLQRRDWVAVDGPAAAGHRVVLDYRVKRDGEVQSEQEGLTFVLGEGPPLGVLQDVLIGMSANETRRLPSTVPAAQDTAPEPDAMPDGKAGGSNPVAAAPDGEALQPDAVEAPEHQSPDDGEQPSEGSAQGSSEQAQQQTTPTGESAAADDEQYGEVTLRKVEEGLLPAVDDEFFDWFGVEKDGDRPAKFRAGVRERMDLEMQAALRRVAAEEVAASLAKAHDFELPPSALLAEVQSMGKTENLPPETLVPRVRLAEVRLRARLVMREIVSRESMRPDEERVVDRIEQIASGYEQPKDVRRAIYADESHMRQLEASALEEQVVEHVSARARVSPVRMSYRDLVAGEPLPKAPETEPDASNIGPDAVPEDPSQTPVAQRPTGWVGKVKRLFAR